MKVASRCDRMILRAVESQRFFSGRHSRRRDLCRKAMIDRDHKLPLARQAMAVHQPREHLLPATAGGKAGLGLMPTASVGCTSSPRSVTEAHRMMRGLLRQEVTLLRAA